MGVTIQAQFQLPTMDDKISVRDFIEDLDIQAQFQLPLSHEAMEELQTLQLDIQGLERDDPNASDTWSWTPGKGSYSAKSYYVLMHSSLPDDDPCKWISAQCVLHSCMKTEIIFSLSATSAPESGIICKFNGMLVCPSENAY